jgi:hypothetical protein
MSVLQIPYLKSFCRDNESHLSPEDHLDLDEPDFLFRSFKSMNKLEIIAALPPRSMLDRLFLEHMRNESITSGMFALCLNEDRDLHV